ncbi:MAG: serine protein kinase RIO [Thermoplasmatota archaeon]
MSPAAEEKATGLPLLQRQDLGLDEAELERLEQERLAFEGKPDPTDPDDVDSYASNDEWAFQKADQLLSTLKQREGVDRRTEGEVFDRPTLMVLHKMLSQGTLASLDFPISTGKEANVFRGTTPMGGHVAVKIYRVNTATFKHVLQYIEGDERFAGAGRDKRRLVAAWAQKEFRNLSRLYEAGVSVPEPIRVLGNVLVTEYIGLPEGPWPQLKDLGRLDREQAQEFYDSLTADLERTVHDAGLVHADLSEYNILVQDSDDPDAARARIIDVGQAVLRSHPMSEEFLERDIRNLTRYFTRQRLRVTEHDLATRLRPRDDGAAKEEEE